MVLAIGPLLGGLTCGLAAYRRRLPVLRYAARGVGYAAVGALYSLMFFVPWVYLTMRMYDKNFPRLAIIIGYTLVFFVWACLTIGYIAYGFSGSSRNPNVLGLAILANIFLWVYSLMHLRRQRRNSSTQSEERQADASGLRSIIPPPRPNPIWSVLMPKEYMMPIVFLYLSIWIFLRLWMADFKQT